MTNWLDGKKYLIIITLLTVLIIPNFASAITVEELQAQIQNLLQQIQQLEEQLAKIQQVTPVWCHDFNVNLKVNMGGNEVVALQTALEKEGFTVSQDEKTNKSFGESTALAVTGFQQKYKDEILTPLGLKYGTGYVGPATRTKLNKLYRCTTTKFSINDRVKTTAFLNVRQTPSKSGKLLGIQPPGALGVVIGGPTYADGYWWWNINYDTGADGWSVKNWLVKYDTIAPSVPANLTAIAVSSSQINLSWTASTDNVGVAGYKIYRCPGSGCTPTSQVATSTTNSYSDTNLSANTTYVYRVAAYDGAGNVSSQSASASATTQAPPPEPSDTTSPSAITDLSASNITQTSLTLTWTAPGDDGNTGTASSYDIRYSTSPIREANWAFAFQVAGEPTSVVAGTFQSMSITGLSVNTTYYFVMKTSDEVPNISPLSNLASATTHSYSLCFPHRQP